MNDAIGRQLLTLLATLVAAVLALALTPGVSGGQEEPPPNEAIDQAPNGGEYASGELLVAFEPGTPGERAIEAARASGAEVEKNFEEIEARLLSFPEIKNERGAEARQRGLERARQALERNPVVRSADYNYVAEPSFTPNDPFFDDQYGYEIPNFERAWDATLGGDVQIGVVDTGIDRGHPDVYDKVVAERDFTGNGSAQDDGGHGTHVAGTAAAITDNGRGVAGACPGCELLIAKSLHDGGGTLDDVIDGMLWTKHNGAEVVNLSLGSEYDAQAFEDAVDYVWNEGVVVVAAAGNSGDERKIYPAAYDNAIAVAATDQNDEQASFSTEGDFVELAAPGVSILSTYLRDKATYAYLSGTSMAAPHVAGLAALISSQGKTNTQIRTRLQNTAVDLGPSGRDKRYGFGRIDAASAVFQPPYRQVVDNADSEDFRASTNWRGGRANPEKYQRNYRFTGPANVNDAARFKIRTPERGRYDVFGWWPSGSNYNNRALYRVFTVDGFERKLVNQRKVGGKWVKLGTYELRGGEGFWVRAERQSQGDGAIMADAVMVREAR